MLLSIRASIEGFCHAVKEELRRRRAVRDRFQAALAFNKLHTFTVMRTAQWMCPICNKVHDRMAWSAFSGIQYPACCRFPEGHRLDHAHATGLPR